MSGVPAEQDNETTDYRTTRQGREQRAEGKALRECVLPGYGATRRSKGQRAGVEMTIRAGLALNDEGMTQARMTNSCSRSITEVRGSKSEVEQQSLSG
jgi:hypothetical protein